MAKVPLISVVDDDESVRESLDGLLRSVGFAVKVFASAEEFLSSDHHGDIDCLLLDVRMPGMNGIELLSEVVKLYPQVLRIIMSGTADQEIALRTVTVAHQYLMKPCDPGVLRAAIQQAFRLGGLLNNAALKKLVSGIHSLPSIPSVYVRLMNALGSSDSSTREIGSIISQDVAMTAKILQLVNSAFFGVSRRIADPAEAVVYLGADAVRALAFSVSVFSQFEKHRAPSFSVEELRNHSVEVASLARRIALDWKLDAAAVEDVFMGGLLHGIGTLVLVTNYPDRYEAVMLLMREEGLSAYEAELKEFGTTHAEAGAYLLCLWNLSDRVAEIVASHHGDPVDRGPVAAVQLAHSLIDQGLRSPGAEAVIANCLSDEQPASSPLRDL